MKKILLLLTIISIASCSTDDATGDMNDSFDRSAMMRNLSDNIIIPSFENLQSKMDALILAKNTFVSSPDLGNLEVMRSAYLNAYVAYQRVEMYNIGKAEEIEYNFKMNVYPTDVTNIENNIATGDYDLLFVNNNDAVGFPALDYLLYGLSESDVDLVSFYDTNKNAAGYKNYLSDNVEQMSDLTTAVLNDWKTEYRDEFIAGTSNNATSPINLIVNDFIFYYEKGLRANKIGIPAGVFSNEKLPNRVEGYYSKNFSKTLAQEALQATQDFFNGVSPLNPEGSAASLAGYTDALETKEINADMASLSDLINTQLNAAKGELNGLNTDLSQQVQTNNTAMLKTYDALQRVVVLLKVDMLQVLNISVDYVDADGD